MEEMKETAGEETGVRAGGRVHPGVQEFSAADGGAKIRRAATATLGATGAHHAPVSDFDTDSKTFTLGALFRHGAAQILRAGDGDASPGKELKMEADVARFEAVWKEQKFELAKYMKGEEDRGYILRSTEEVTLILTTWR